MPFLNRLHSLFGGFTRRSRDRFARIPDPDEPLARFLFTKSHFSSQNRRVKPAAFLPSPDPLETSVFRTLIRK